MASSGVFSLFALGHRREVHHHDAVLLDQADEHDHADERVEAEIRLEDQQRQPELRNVHRGLHKALAFPHLR
jgi:hypothetical protein